MPYVRSHYRNGRWVRGYYRRSSGSAGGAAVGLVLLVAAAVYITHLHPSAVGTATKPRPSPVVSTHPRSSAHRSQPKLVGSSRPVAKTHAPVARAKQAPKGQHSSRGHWTVVAAWIIAVLLVASLVFIFRRRRAARRRIEGVRQRPSSFVSTPTSDPPAAGVTALPVQPVPIDPVISARSTVVPRSAPAHPPTDEVVPTPEPTYDWSSGWYSSPEGEPCPVCRTGAKTLRRSRRHGQFYGCTSFPSCRASWQLDGSRIPRSQ